MDLRGAVCASCCCVFLMTENPPDCMGPADFSMRGGMKVSGVCICTDEPCSGLQEAFPSEASLNLSGTVPGEPKNVKNARGWITVTGGNGFSDGQSI